MEQTANQPANFKACSICGKDIEEPKYRIHEATCARNNFKCQDCGEIVPKADKDHHITEFHTQTPCEYCKTFTADKKSLAGHLNMCSMRPKQCLYCEMNLGGEKYLEHLNYCGSKTKRCDLCKQNVQNKDLTEHEDGQCKFYQEIEKQKVQRELLQFQEEQQRKAAQQKIEQHRQNQLNKEKEYERRQLEQSVPQQFQNKVISENIGGGIPQARSQATSRIQGPANTGAGIGGGNDQFDEDQEMIARLLQEELDAEEAAKLANEQHSPGQQRHQQNMGYDEYGNEAYDNVRPPTDIYEDQMIGGPQSMNFPQSRGQTHTYTTYHPSGFGQTTTTTFSSSFSVGPNANINRPANRFEPLAEEQNYHEEDSHMANDFNDDEQLNRAIAESMGMNAQMGVHGQGIGIGGGGGAVQQNNVDETEEEILRQILEQSKNEM
ncbi:UNKNOWN [Stylonychia lemnae]|uniref:TRAFD1/XAF1 zinc finger domain-containing protein n=1 Tax=Stylonychia lemnae TaxID=5949 RepID=A0A078BBF7_STYLE|nr:UNKNOWN [Stylonychia lemnae]|eukprot:CDW91546.1 UNKNOWN [Stylonychia lemnae]